MDPLLQKIEGLLYWKAEPVTFSQLAKLLDSSVEEVKSASAELQAHLSSTQSGLMLVTEGETVALMTHPALDEIISQEEKAEETKELSKAALETLSIIIYRGPLLRSEIDYIRGVNSQFILRSLLTRGLITKSQKQGDERMYVYSPSVDLLAHLGIENKASLPDFDAVNADIEQFMEQEVEQSDKQDTLEAHE